MSRSAQVGIHAKRVLVASSVGLYAWSTVGGCKMIEVILNDRLGKKVRVKCK